VVFYDDDPAVSAAVIEWNRRMGIARAIVTNGKSDGSTMLDYPTMALASVIPALLVERPSRAFVIGFGTGVTVGELLQTGSVEHVDVAEISQGVIRAAPFFDFASFGVSKART
jgi:spermidine synthase